MMNFSELLDEYIDLKRDIDEYEKMDYSLFDDKKEERLVKARRLNRLRGMLNRAVIIDNSFTG